MMQRKNVQALSPAALRQHKNARDSIKRGRHLEAITAFANCISLDLGMLAALDAADITNIHNALLKIQPSENLSEINISSLLMLIELLDKEDQIPLLKQSLSKTTALGKLFCLENAKLGCEAEHAGILIEICMLLRKSVPDLKNEPSIFNDYKNAYINAILIIGKHHLSHGHTTESVIWNYTKALLHIEDAAIYYERCRLYLEQKKYPKALADFIKAIKIDSTLVIDSSLLKTILSNIDARHHLSQMEISKLSTFINARPMEDKTSLLTLLNGAQQHNFASAPKERHDSYYYNSLGCDHHKQNNDPAAIAAFTRAILLDSKFKYAYLNRGHIYFSQNNNDQALNDFTQAIKLDATNMHVYNSRGYIYYKQQKYSEALADFNETIKLDANNKTAAYANRGYTYFKQQKYSEALADFVKATTLNPTLVIQSSVLKDILSGIKASHDLSQIKKSDLLALIKTLPTEDQIPLLKKSLSQGTLLGRRFWKEEGSSCKLTRDILKEIGDLLKELAPQYEIPKPSSSFVSFSNTVNTMFQDNNAPNFDEPETVENAVNMHNCL